MICELPGIHIAHIRICCYAPTDNVESDLICQSLDSRIVHMDLLYGCVMTDDVLLDLISELLDSHIPHMDNLFQQIHNNVNAKSEK